MGHYYRERHTQPIATTTSNDLAGLGAAATTDTDEELRATQAALELAAELGVDPATIQGTGKDGRITKGDVEAAAEAL